MEPVDFDQVNRQFGKHQTEYEILPAHCSEDGKVTTCWRLSSEDISKINESGLIYVQMLTFNQKPQPIIISTDPIKLEE